MAMKDTDAFRRDGQGNRVWLHASASPLRTLHKNVSSQPAPRYTTQGWLNAAGWIELDDSDQGNVRC